MVSEKRKVTVRSTLIFMFYFFLLNCPLWEAEVLDYIPYDKVREFVKECQLPTNLTTALFWVKNRDS
jgi:hypothetical protein